MGLEINQIIWFLSICVSQGRWVKIKPTVNKYLTGDAAIMRQSHEVDKMKEKKERVKEETRRKEFLPVITAYFDYKLSL